MKPRPTPTSPKQQSPARQLEALYRTAPTIIRPRTTSFSVVSLVVVSVFITIAAFVGLRMLADRFPEVALFKFFRTEVREGERVVIREERQNSTSLSVAFERVERSLAVLLQERDGGLASPDDRLGLAVFLTNDGVGVTLKNTIPKKINPVVAASGGDSHAMTKQTADLATPFLLFQVNGETAPMSFGDLERLAPGDELLIVRNDPFHGGFSILQSRISATRDRVLTNSSLAALLESSEVVSRRLRLDRELDSTWNGAAAVDRDGRLIGLVDASGAGGGNATVLPIESVRNLISTFARKGEIQRPLLGVTYIDLSFSTTLDRLPQKGAYLLGGDQGKPPAVVPRSPAALAGLQAHDVITGVEDLVITEARSLSEILLQYDPRSKIVLHALRNQTPFDTTVTLGEATSSG